MPKILTFTRSKKFAAEDFQVWLRGDGAPAFLRAHANIENVMVRATRVPPVGLPYRPPSDTTAVGMRPIYDAILVTRYSPAAAARDIAQAWARQLGGDVTTHSYLVTETVILDRLATPETDAAPSGITLLGQLMFHADMPDSAARRSWALHAKLAVAVHVGALRYVQNWVDAALDADCPPARGMPEMLFASDADLVERFFDSPRGAAEILQDTAHFVASGPRFYTTAHAVRRDDEIPHGRTQWPDASFSTAMP